MFIGKYPRHRRHRLVREGLIETILARYTGVDCVANSDLPMSYSLRVLQGTGEGMSIDLGCPEKIAAGFCQLPANPDHITQMKRAALKTAKRYLWPVQAERLVGVNATVLGREGSARG